MDLIIKRQEDDPKKKMSKRIFLVTDAGNPINKDDLSIVIDQFKKMEVKLNVMYNRIGSNS